MVREVNRCRGWRLPMLKSCDWRSNRKLLVPRTRVTTIACTESCSSVRALAAAGWPGEDPRTIQRWVHRFETAGFAGLQEGERPGRPVRLTEAQVEAVGRDLRRSPRLWGYSQNLWDGKLLAHHLAKAYGVDLGPRQCQRLFHRLRFRLRKPRSVIAHADAAAQARYKKTPSPGR